MSTAGYGRRLELSESQRIAAHLHDIRVCTTLMWFIVLRILEQHFVHIRGRISAKLAVRHLKNQEFFKFF